MLVYQLFRLSSGLDVKKLSQRACGIQSPTLHWLPHCKNFCSLCGRDGMTTVLDTFFGFRSQRLNTRDLSGYLKSHAEFFRRPAQLQVKPDKV